MKHIDLIGTPGKHSTRDRRLLLVLLVLCIIGLSMLMQLERKSESVSAYLQSVSSFEDSAANMTAIDVVSNKHLFVTTAENSLNFGLSKSVYWVWIKLQQNDATEHNLKLELGYPHLDQIEVYRMQAGTPVREYSIGDTKPFDTRPIKDRTFVIPIEVDQGSGSAELLLRAQSQGSIQLPIKIKTEQQYQLDDRDEQLMLGFYYGILLGVLAYNLLLAVGTRESVYGYYCAYAVFLILFQLSQNGLAFEYLWQNQMHWHQISIPLFASLALLFCTLFTQLFLTINHHTWPRLFVAFRILIVVFGALAVASLVADRTLVITLVSVAVSLAGIFMMGTALYMYINGDDNAFYYLLAWTILLFGIVIYATKTLGLIPETFFTEYSVQIGSAIEMVLLSYALADRFNRLGGENIRIQTEAKETLESNVKQRTAELQQTMQQLEVANARLESMNQKDPMTGLYNRRYFNEVLETLRSSMATQHKPMALLMIDIDHFKSINDTRGHLVGDNVIRRIATAIENTTSGRACVPVRFGGEEFMTVMPGYDQAEAMEIAEQLRTGIESMSFSTANEPPESVALHPKVFTASNDTFKVTVSIGVAVEYPLLAGTQTGLKLLDQADQALYTAKETGRNRSVLHQPSKPDAPHANAA